MSLNYGKQIQTIPGIQGVAPGGQAQVQLNPNRRVSRLNFQCTGIAYVAPVLTLPAAAGATVQPTFNVTLTAGVITGVTVNSATATGAADGIYQAVITDTVPVVGGTVNNSYSADVRITIDTAAVTAISLVSGGVVSPVPIEVFFAGQILQTVGGVNMRDLNAAQIKACALADDANAPAWRLGELDIQYVKPSARFTSQPDITIWDLWGQSVLQLQMPITAGITSPGLVGVYEFDADVTLRLTASVGGKAMPVLQPVAQHAQTFPIAAGVSLQSITTIPFLINPSTPLPILRLYLQEQTPGNITKIELDQDGNKILQLTEEQIKQMYSAYGFDTGAFGAMFVADIDRRVSRALRVNQSMTLWVSSAVSQQITVIRETLPGAYSGG